ncbi:HAMP domain-containing sensor histidine kinase [Elioraea sp.]|uniref:sensor histidine kinase n=1 Tax=Elioraea sp. TaxID=2185103 RepID=UPI0025B7E27F|nr:HAMP domain-containing sensor histidine kinase [Elioraea sp.]
MRHGLFRTTAFRLTALHLALTLAGTALLAAIAWWATVGFATRQASEEIDRGMRVLGQSAALSGLRGVALSIEARLAADRAGVEYYLLAAPDGQRLVGNLASAPPELGWQRLDVSRAGGDVVPVLALGARLAGGATVFVGRDLSSVQALEQRLLAAAGWVGLGAVVIGLAGGLLIGRGIARRTAAMDAALAAVGAGDLGRRLPIAGRDDEFDRLSFRINAMLDRLGAVMAALRSVTDDIAHDLRTPLTRLRQRLDEVSRAATAAAAKEAAAAAEAECDAILDLFAALLRIAQVEAGAQRSAFARVDLSAVVESVAEVYAPAAEERGQVLSAGIAAGLAAVGDRALITQMLANLVENAIRHGRDGGHVRLLLSPLGEGAEVIIEDDGPGIPAEERERVFRRFHRLDAARATPGSGLGLALVRAVAALHGMTVTLEDAGTGPGPGPGPVPGPGPGPGLRVRVELPRVVD